MVLLLRGEKMLNAYKQNRMVVTTCSEWKKLGEAGKRVQTFSYKMNKILGSNVEHGEYS